MSSGTFHTTNFLSSLPDFILTLLMWMSDRPTKNTERSAGEEDYRQEDMGMKIKYIDLRGSWESEGVEKADAHTAAGRNQIQTAESKPKWLNHRSDQVFECNSSSKHKAQAYCHPKKCLQVTEWKTDSGATDRRTKIRSCLENSPNAQIGRLLGSWLWYKSTNQSLQGIFLILQYIHQ